MTKEMKKRSFILEEPNFSKARFLDFKVEREEWNKYLLEDETSLRAKLVLTSGLTDKSLATLIREAKSAQKLRIGFGFKSINLFASESPSKLRGSPDSKRYSPKQLKSFIAKEELDFETKRETWNSYVFENGMKVKAKISPTSVSRTSKFDAGGMPIYLIDSTVDLKLTLPDKIEEILKKRLKAKTKK